MSGNGVEQFKATEAKVLAGERLSAEDGLALLQVTNLPMLAFLADTVRRRKHPEQRVTYVVGRIINYTNVCWVKCSFCAFYRLPGHAEGYVLSREEIFRKIQELIDHGGTEVLFQGGLNPELKIDYFEDTFRAIKERFPVHIHGLSPAELIYLAKISQLSLRETLLRLQAAGLDSVPGGGAEILVDEVRQAISPLKDTVEEWLDCMRTAHQVGIPSSATMMFGSVETAEQRIEHLLRLRALQDETSGFTAFVAWNFQPEGTELNGKRASAFDYLRTMAVSRLMLDNIDHLQASWLTQGPKVAQVALHYGVNDLGSTIFEERVVSAGGARFMASRQELERVIVDAGYTPRVRNTRYEILG
ncbi:MAG: cyclic dehypoxanthinyl futalosine synthase [Candidatus Methylomirabilales bacterium]